MTKTAFREAVRRDGINLAKLYAEALGVTRAQIELWALTI